MAALSGKTWAKRGARPGTHSGSLPWLLGKIFICSANHASAPSNRIQGTFLTLLSHQVQILQPRLGSSQPFYSDPPAWYSRVLALSLLACCIVHCVTKTSARLPPHRYKPAIRSAWRTDSWSDIPRPVFGNLYTKNSVSLNRSMENVPGTTPV